MSGIRAPLTAGAHLSPLLSLVLLSLFPVPCAAVPPEVANLTAAGNGTLRWDFVGEAGGYNLYRTTRLRLLAGDYGDCLVGSHRTTSLAVPEGPGPGEVHLFLVTAFDQTGEGTAGFRLDGTERVLSSPCVPARRHFGFAANGDPGDGVLDGVSPARNADATVHSGNGPGLETTGVFLHSGEFFLSARDLSYREQLGSYDWPGEYAARFDGVTPTGGKPPNLAAAAHSTHAPIAIPSLLQSRKSANAEASPGGSLGGDGISWENDPRGSRRNDFGALDPYFSLPSNTSGPALSKSHENSFNHAFIASIPKYGGDLYCDWLLEHKPSMEICGDMTSDNCEEWVDCCEQIQQELEEFYELFIAYCTESVGGLQAPAADVCPVCSTEPSSWDTELRRTYRSQVDYDGPLGHGWDLEVNERLVPALGDVVHHDGRGPADRFVRSSPSTFGSPPGIYSVLIQNAGGSFTLRDRDGTLHDFHAFDGTSREGAIEKVTDRSGRFASFLYDHQGLLTTMVDALGRSVRIAYDGSGRIASVTDFAGRQVRYGYDAGGDLVSIRSPAVTGTPNGNDFPDGKETTYRYTTGYADARLNHNLEKIIRPNDGASGPAAIQITYGSAAGSFNLDRVAAETIGGTNGSGVPAGGTLTFAYQSLNPGQPPDPVTPRRKASVTDRNGNLKEIVHNAAGNLLTRTDFTNRNLRPGEPDYTSRYSHNADGELLEVVRPLGNRTLYSYDVASPNRGSQGNLLQIRRVADAAASGGRGDGRGGPIADRIWTFTYEPVFNGRLSVTDPRGNDPSYVPQNGGTQSAGRYTSRWTYDFQEGDPARNGIGALAARFGIDLGGLPLNLGDRNGDGDIGQASGNTVREDRPSVRLDPASNQAAIEGDTSQEIVALYEWNGHGQPTAVTDAEGNRHQFEYFPETDPDGDGVSQPPPDDGRVLDPVSGGYLKSVRVDTASGPGRDNGTDPPPVALRHDFRYDRVGNLTGFVDGRGVLTRLVVNALNQIVETRRAAATADATGPDGDPPTGRGEPGLAALGFKTRYSYDANDNLVRMEVEDRGATRGLGPFIETTWTYDILGNRLSMAQETTPAKSLVTRYRYDANENPIAVIEPLGNLHALAWDERGLLLVTVVGSSGALGGTPSEFDYDYDANGNLARFTDGLGGLIDCSRDGFDRLVRSTDQAGNTTDRYFDPVSRPVRIRRRGPAGGPTPPDRSGATNVDLADARLLHDELGRLFRVDRSLFVPAGATPIRPPILSEGPLVPADGSINVKYEYDRLSRLTFTHGDSGVTTRKDYDGASRLKYVLYANPGTPARSGGLFWDPGNNLIETVLTEFPSPGAAGGPPAETFLTTGFHDALGRRTMVVDSAGQTRRYVCDSLDALVAVSDPRGPDGGTILRRSPGNESTVVPINAHGNVTTYTYDGAGRRLSASLTLTATGEGDGTLTPPPDDGNEFNPDGLITERLSYTDNSLLEKRTDDRGNVTTYSYDNLNRRVSVTGDDDSVHRYDYDRQGNVTRRTDPNGSEFVYTYDPVHRPVRIAVARGRDVVGTTEQMFEHDGLGRLTRATDDNALPPDDGVTLKFVYDSLSRLVEEAREGAAGGPSLATDYGWRAETLLTDLVYPDGRRIGYGYDGADRLVLVDDLDVTRPEQAAYQYFGTGRIHTRTNAAGLRTTRLNDSGNADIGFDAARRTTLLRHLTSTGTLLAGFEYRYDRQGNPASHRRLHHPAAGGGALKGERYAYDSADRLISFREGFLDADHLLAPPPDDGIDWMLDGASNWSLMVRNGVTYKATPNNMNEYGEPKSGGVAFDDGIPDDFHDGVATGDPDGLNLANDPNGNLTFDGRHVLYFDAFGRLVRAERASDGAQVAAYTYDALGRRATRVVTNSGGLDESRDYRYSWYFQGNAGGVIEERELDGVVARQVVHGPDGPIWQILPGGVTHYILEDPSGSSIALFSPGARGGIVERVTYDPHGKPQFETPANVPILDEIGRFQPQSQYGNAALFHGMWYEPELGARADNPNDDWGGLYTGDSEWQYVPVNRVALFLESSLYGGLEWAVFQPGGWRSYGAQSSIYVAQDSTWWSWRTRGWRFLSGPMPLGKDVLVLDTFSGKEAISELFSFHLGMYDPNKGREISTKRCDRPCP